jgi:hypothetical protein
MTFPAALPMLLMAEMIVDKRVRLVVNQFETAELLYEEDKPSFGKYQRNHGPMVESAWAEAVILVLVYGNLIFRWVAMNPRDPPG